MDSHSVDLTDANVIIKAVIIFVVGRAAKRRSAALKDDGAGFLASCDELRDQISDYGQAAQRRRLI